MRASECSVAPLNPRHSAVTRALAATYPSRRVSHVCTLPFVSASLPLHTDESTALLSSHRRTTTQPSPTTPVDHAISRRVARAERGQWQWVDHGMTKQGDGPDLSTSLSLSSSPSRGVAVPTTAPVDASGKCVRERERVRVGVRKSECGLWRAQRRRWRSGLGGTRMGAEHR